MSDIVERLRAWVYTDSQYATAREAADEIERLRKAPCPHVVGTTTRYCSLTPLTLTDDEREVLLAIESDAAYRAMWRTGQVVGGLIDRTK